MEREKIFNSYKNHLMDFKEGGTEYFKNMIRGYISHVRGADPLTFARRVDKGTKPDELMFIKVVRCVMLPFQKKIYEETIKNKKLVESLQLDEKLDTLDRKSEAVANFAFPGLSQDRKEMVGYFGKEGIGIVKNQIKTNYDLLNKKIASDIIGNKDESDLIYMSESGKTITGKILKIDYLKYFSIKFHTALKKLNKLVWGIKGPKTAFVYSNLVKVGIELFEEILLQNGYLEYQEDKNYQIRPETLCYYCGKTYRDHQGTKRISLSQNGGKKTTDSDSSDDEKGSVDSFTEGEMSDNSDSESSSSAEKVLPKEEAPPHQFFPGTFISVTGKPSEESAEIMPEDKKKLTNAFNIIENKTGKFIKFVLGSKVMNEGISLMNVSEVHVLDVYFNLGRVDQVVGRAIRHCSHYNIMSEDNRFPYVNVYKYVVSVKDGLSTEEELYQKAEMKYMLIKKVERSIKEVALDCPLNTNGNIFKEEVEKYKDCGKEGKDACPAICDYTTCHYKCDDIKLNAEFYDPNRKIYKKIPKDKLDYSTFTHSLARNEIEYAKKRIKELYMKKYVYTLHNILEYVKGSYDEDKRELFDEFFVFKGLDELIPVTENDFNNFRDTVIDKFNRQGYLIYINKYYIFQPFDQNEEVPMYYRTTYDKQIAQKLSLYNYLKNTTEYKQYKGKQGSDLAEDEEDLLKEDIAFYNFEDAMEYYDSRDEFKYVGIIDKEISRRKSKQIEDMKDVFKIREKRDKILDKKRGTGIPSLKGAVCSTSKNKEYLESIAKQLKIDSKHAETRTDICELVRLRMLELEKYSVGKEKITYIMIPTNHPEFQFPYNLEDRVEFIKRKLMDEIKFKIEINVKKEIRKDGKEKGLPFYKVIIKDNPKLKEYEKILEDLKGKKDGKDWAISVM
jgi:hypothetical protein